MDDRPDLDADEAVPSVEPIDRIRDASVAVDARLLAEAEEVGLDVVRLVEDALRTAVRKKRLALEWQAENREAIDAYNRMVREKGPLLRAFWDD